MTDAQICHVADSGREYGARLTGEDTGPIDLERLDGWEEDGDAADWDGGGGMDCGAGEIGPQIGAYGAEKGV